MSEIHFCFSFSFCSSFDKSANSEPLSAVILLNTSLNLLPKNSLILSRAFVTDISEWEGISDIIAYLVLRSTSVSKTLSLLDFLPNTQSIFQCPNSSWFSIELGRSEILVPSFFLLFLTFSRLFISMKFSW